MFFLFSFKHNKTKHVFNGHESLFDSFPCDALVHSQEELLVVDFERRKVSSISFQFPVLLHNKHMGKRI
jgi:hypothetical protein